MKVWGHHYYLLAFLSWLSPIELPKQPIKIVLPDGKAKEGTSFVTSPLDVAKMISNSLPEKITVSKVKYTNRIVSLDEGLVNVEDEEEGGEAGW
jgi:hypothetical protein